MGKCLATILGVALNNSSLPVYTEGMSLPSGGTIIPGGSGGDNTGGGTGGSTGITVSDLSSLLSTKYSSFDQNKFETFINDIGGLNGSIWNKIVILYMPLFCTESDKNVFWNVKDGSTWGRNKTEIEALGNVFQREASMNSDNIGWKIVGNGESANTPTYPNLQYRDTGLTTKNACMFGVCGYFDTPAASQTADAYSADGGILVRVRNRTNVITIDLVDDTQLSVPKNESGYDNDFCYAMTNDGNQMGIVSNVCDYTTVANTFTESRVNAIMPIGMLYAKQTINCALFTISGLAKNLTVTEATQLYNALKKFL